MTCSVHGKAPIGDYAFLDEPIKDEKKKESMTELQKAVREYQGMMPSEEIYQLFRKNYEQHKEYDRDFTGAKKTFVKMNCLDRIIRKPKVLLCAGEAPGDFMYNYALLNPTTDILVMDYFENDKNLVRKQLIGWQSKLMDVQATILNPGHCIGDATNIFCVEHILEQMNEWTSNNKEFSGRDVLFTCDMGANTQYQTKEEALAPLGLFKKVLETGERCSIGSAVIKFQHAMNEFVEITDVVGEIDNLCTRYRHKWAFAKPLGSNLLNDELYLYSYHSSAQINASCRFHYSGIDSVTESLKRMSHSHKFVQK